MATDEPIQSSERVLIDDRPHFLFLLTASWRWVVVGVLSFVVLSIVGGRLGSAILGTLAWIPIALIVLRLIYGLLDWIARRHILTENRIISQFGILSCVRTELPLARVQHLVLVRPFSERLFGLGSIGVASAGTGSVELVWRAVDHPQKMLDSLRTQIDAYAKVDESSANQDDSEPVTPTSMAMPAVPVIGLVGGVGSGKSTVARFFAQRGFRVSNSDQAVRELLTTQPVIDQLVAWWGHGVLDKAGQINRGAIADIVFKDPAQRLRLEGLIHPLLHHERQAVIERARQDGAPGVIVDAPLLFEAGVDKECDTVVFVDTPESIRSSRVLTNRGWDAAEFGRREDAQMGVEDKRLRSDHVIVNDGLESDLERGVEDLIEKIRLSNRRSLSGDWSNQDS